MDENASTNNQIVTKASPAAAGRILDDLLAQARIAHQPGEITVLQKWVKVKQRHCRVAVVISKYGTLFEIGSRRGTESQITSTFQEEELPKARALLAEYFT
jgi:hypothetical protein